MNLPTCSILRKAIVSVISSLAAVAAATAADYTYMAAVAEEADLAFTDTVAEEVDLAFTDTVATADSIATASGVPSSGTPSFRDLSFGTPSFRARGYKGSVTISNMGIIWCGLDSSHGYMFNAHHYLGGGVGVMISPFGSPPAFFFHIYADYNAYWFDRKSTPVAGIRIGYVRSSKRGNLSAFELEPSIGWSWGTKSGYGLALCLGLDIITVPVNFTESSSLPFTALPKLNFAFEF